MTISDVLVPAEAVVKVQVLDAANALPAASFTPSGPLLIVAVYVVPAARSAPGFNVATLPVYVAAADTGVAPGVVAVSVNVFDVTVEAFIASEKVPVTFAVTATSVASVVGDVAVTAVSYTHLTLPTILLV